MILQLKNIEHNFGEIEFNFSASISSSITGVYGPSGAGKSTMLNLLCGTEKPKNGKILINNRTVFDSGNGTNISSNKRNIGVVFQENYLFPHLTVKKNLKYSERYIKSKKTFINFDATIDLLQLNQLLDKMPDQLSGGERQRVAIGRALLSQPELLLFDEPFSNLDKQHRREITSYLLKINNQYTIPMLIVSHDLEDILRLTKSLVIMREREVIATGNYMEIAESGAAKNIITHKRYLNTLDARYVEFEKEHMACKFANSVSSEEFLYINSELFNKGLEKDQKIRFCISPDDIALSTDFISGTSFQNQLKGKIKKSVEIKKSVFVMVDCGFLLMAEISVPAYKKLELENEKEIYCLIKAKAIEVVHIFKKTAGQ